MATTRSGKQLDTSTRVTKSRRGKKTASKPQAQETQPADARPSSALYFWRETDPKTGWLSQWYPCAFTDNDGVVYKTAEHYMMYQKAVLFSDPSTGAEILAAGHPRLVKALGRKVANFDDKVWNRERERIVCDGTRFKFTRPVSEEELRLGDAEDSPLLAPLTLRQLLLSTGSEEIVEASPMDRIWGVGFGPAKAEGNRARWGLNLLGKALMAVREELRLEQGQDGEE